MLTAPAAAITCKSPFPPAGSPANPLLKFLQNNCFILINFLENALPIFGIIQLDVMALESGLLAIVALSYPAGACEAPKSERIPRRGKQKLKNYSGKSLTK